MSCDLDNLAPASWLIETGRCFLIKTIERRMEKRPHSPVRPMALTNLILIPISLILALLAWWLVTRMGSIPAFIFPSPGLVWERFIQLIQDGSLIRHTSITLGEIISGLALGVSAATSLGYWLAKSPRLEKLLSPYIVASQSIPTIAIAPLLIIWFEAGFLSKVLICALTVFFPVLVNTVVGVRSVPDDLRDLMRSLQATRWQTLKILEIPASMPVFLGGLRVGATLSVIGAVIGEFVGADRGLGFLINRGKGQYDTALVFVAVFALVTLALGLYGCVAWLERRLLAWRQKPEQTLISET